MSFLLDTNVVSEWTKPRPNSGLITWLDEADEERVFLSVATLAELRHGVERLPAGRRRKLLDAWLSQELPLRFESRILSVDNAVADAWGRLVAQCEAPGRSLAAMDGLIAATAVVHGHHNLERCRKRVGATSTPFNDARSDIRANSQGPARAVIMCAGRLCMIWAGGPAARRS